MEFGTVLEAWEPNTILSPPTARFVSTGASPAKSDPTPVDHQSVAAVPGAGCWDCGVRTRPVGSMRPVTVNLPSTTTSPVPLLTKNEDRPVGPPAPSANTMVPVGNPATLRPGPVGPVGPVVPTVPVAPVPVVAPVNPPAKIMGSVTLMKPVSNAEIVLVLIVFVS